MEISKWLKQKGSQENCPFSESAYRCAVSRAYYAAFLYAENFAVKNFNYRTPQGKNSHSCLADVYEKSEFHLYRKIGKILKKMKRLRIKCDYKRTPVTNLKRETENTIQEAEKIITELKQLKNK
ncbi:HEPN domain-containing protein [Methanolapillus africanus]|uniref:HEPN domain-containing protein n=1 Tax=Methanolapillus africanus TaxID=3028297 RepID=UPI0030B8D038